MNLLSNAINHCGSGVNIGVEIGIRRDRSQISVTVVDDGPGIPPEIIDTVGMPFIHAHTPETNKATAGAGLGLSIVTGLLKANGGRLELASTPGIGTRVMTVWPTCAT